MQHNSDVKIRPYKDSDYEAVKKALQEGKLFDGGWDSRKNLRKKIKTTKGSILVAEKDGKVIGSIYACTDGWEAMLFRLAVRNRYRNQGIGTKLLRSAELYLKKKGVKHVALLANRRNRMLHKYYTKRGYTTPESDYTVFIKNRL